MRLLVVVGVIVAAGALALATGVSASVAFGQGTMPGGMSGMGMVGGMSMMGGPFSPSARPVSMDQAIEVLKQRPAAHHLDGFVLDEVEAYTQNYYGQFKEQSTGRGAIQVLVDRYTDQAVPEMGPNMMWNTKYGQIMMGEMMNGMGMGGMGMPGMMGGGMGSPGMMAAPASGTGTDTPAAQISLEDARRAAGRFLSGYLPGARVGNGDAFYGYDHFDVLRGIRQVGMLSVNDRTGQVWYHTWHGEFLEKRKIAQP